MAGRSWIIRSVAVLGPLLAGPPADAQVRAAVEWIHPAEVIYVSDFNPLIPGQHPDLLSIVLQNGAAGEQTVVLALTISMERPRQAVVVRGETAPFVLREPLRRITNRDIASGDGDVAFADYEFGGPAGDLRDRILETGRLPAGTYRFAVEVRTPQGVVLDRAELRREVVNPTRLELLGPGAPFGEPPPVVTSPSPRFLWTAGAGLVAGGGPYRLRVVRADGAASAEEAMQGFAAWEDVTDATSAVYPGSSAALRLEPGATYAWQVVREVRTSGGVDELESPIYWFRMAGTAQGITATGDPATDAVSRQIRRLAELLGLGGELDGFRPADPVLVDGRPVPLHALEGLLRAIIAGEVPVRSITVR